MTPRPLFLIVSSYAASDSVMRVALIFLLCTLSSCAYYNTFYNAKKFYSEAQSAQSNKGELLDKCIEKCAKVIEYHSNSRWVDDAIFLMGKCFYEKRNYSRARTKFQELLTYFPDSPFRDETTLYLGRSYLGEGEYALAIETFGRLEDSRFRCDARFDMAEAMYVTDDYEGAVKAYQNLLESCPGISYREVALEKLAASLLKMKEYSTGIELYQSLLKGRLSEDERLEVSLRIADAYLELSEPENALDILLKADRDIKSDHGKARIRLKLSESYRKLGRLEEAIHALGEASQLAPKSETSALSYYHLGAIYEQEYVDFEKAKEAYAAVLTEDKAVEVSQEAARKVTTFNTIEKLKSDLQDESVENPAETQFLLAELLVIELQNTDLAIEEYQKVATQFEDSEYAPKAIYAIAWIYKNLKADPQTADEYFRRLIEEHSETEYADVARKTLSEKGDLH